MSQDEAISAINLPAPYLRRVWLDPARRRSRGLSVLPAVPAGRFRTEFRRRHHHYRRRKRHREIDPAGGHRRACRLRRGRWGKGYMPVDHSDAREAMGGSFPRRLRASWLPKITNGWFFRAESFFSVARYLDEAARDAGQPPGLPLAFAWRRFPALLRGALPAPGHLHLRRTGIGAVAGASDRVPETVAAHGESRICQVIMATHAPMLMAYPERAAAAAPNTAWSR